MGPELEVFTKSQIIVNVCVDFVIICDVIFCIEIVMIKKKKLIKNKYKRTFYFL